MAVTSDVPGNTPTTRATIRATVTVTVTGTGTEPYSTEVWIHDGQLGGDCSCANGQDGYYCKHQVALALNQVVSQRMAKKQQMRWTDEGAHRLVQVREAVLNGDFTVKRLAALPKVRAQAANQSHVRRAA